ncbi:unnamed protein product [Dovyalis caffra]|uniref:Uncharacterized protein n=1 Tax=Dovyalis caffra TaxID=77055 RepID=A0AAV1RKH7_9ROSI|nr:unnamed protein product [Dovyalis caffra]
MDDMVIGKGAGGTTSRRRKRSHDIFKNITKTWRPYNMNVLVVRCKNLRTTEDTYINQYYAQNQQIRNFIKQPLSFSFSK